MWNFYGKFAFQIALSRFLTPSDLETIQQIQLDAKRAVNNERSLLVFLKFRWEIEKLAFKRTDKVLAEHFGRIA